MGTLATSRIADLAESSPALVADADAWGHVDVYAWNDADRPGKPTGGEAQGLRAAYELLKSRTA